MSTEITLVNIDKAQFYKRKSRSIFMHAQSIESSLTFDRISLMAEEELSLRLELLNKTEVSFNLAHGSLEELDYDEIDSPLPDEFEELILSAKSIVLQEIGKRKVASLPCSTLRQEPAMDSAASQPNKRLRLPEIKLPEFSGGYTEYANFFSMFSTIIDQDPDLSPVEKLQHLKSCLKGSALDSVRSLDICNDNYAVALDLLNKRFNNKRLIFQAHIAEILGMQKVENATAARLREFSDKINTNLRSLQSMGTAEQISGSIIIHIAPTITGNQPSLPMSPENWNIPANLQLADPDFHKPQKIDLLIGASLFFELLCVGQIKLTPGLPLLQKTRLGWVVAGGGSEHRESSALAAQTSVSSVEEVESPLDEILRRFWEIESVPDYACKFSKEELECEEHFKTNFARLATGAYSVRLPLKHSLDMLGDSYAHAYRRFLNLEHKLQRHPQLKSQYSAFIREYLDLNHMSLVSKDSIGLCQYYLPHHCVFKKDSTTTKLRVVFDGSARTSSGSSLNDVLMAGPTIQPKLFRTLLQFRTFPVALTGDICKMYRCVRVAEPDSFLQCLLWRDSPSQEIQVYRLDTVTYGTKRASFLSVRAMHQLAIDEENSYPIGSQILKRDFYVDDLITGGNSAQDVLEIMRQTQELLGKGQFKLRKWCSNDPVVLKETPEPERETFLKFDDGSDITKTLGLAWDPTSDVLMFSFSPMQRILKPSKRSVLSTIARFYDPLGLICPVITKAKIFLQQLWKEKLDWDESLPSALNSSWLKLTADIACTQQMKFPRLAVQPAGIIELHGFSDASINAYGGCIYAVSSSQGRREAQLLCAKSRVAPLKTLTIPKLELCAALLLSQLIREVRDMNVFSCPFFCWSDSSVVLSWIKDEPSRFQVFTANRIASIQELTNGMDWRYVPTFCNPADILSRGSLPSELLESSLWSRGPSFLCNDRIHWPAPHSAITPLPEMRNSLVAHTTPSNDMTLQCKFSNSWQKLTHVFAYVFKFRHRIRHSGITVEHIQLGTQLLLRTIQMNNLAADYKRLQDEFGIMRVGGRLKNSGLAFESQHPIILPRSHPVTHALIMHFHRRKLHSGPRSLLAHIRLQYWPIGGRKTVTTVVNKCIICFRAKPRLFEHVMADLPKSRVSSTWTFMVTGLDFCGPFHYRTGVRGKVPVKTYVCIFICFSTKAVHLELVQDLSTQAFLGALKRFILTRGKPARIWSDNATNFVGAKNELTELKRLFLCDPHIRSVQEFCLEDNIEWRFIPPRSPHFGGLWEAAVKTAKFHFYRSVGPSLLSFDELRTLVCHIGAIINSRPLLPLSENPADLDVLTPAHFLGTAPLVLFPEPDVTLLNCNRLDRWQRISYHQQVFWARWREEYLTLLQQRAKWRTNHPNLKINDVVLVKDENLPPLKWPLARVDELIAGEDKVVR
ncbi:uncharacterized protein LOC122320892, partial [Drosophila ficusphila]|uniref:uncharacterized protein LOC122320892 n=1 Tax=Drosophila ficusphila TaxID=30025 RepID=UPI001C8A6243